MEDPFAQPATMPAEGLVNFSATFTKTVDAGDRLKLCGCGHSVCSNSLAMNGCILMAEGTIFGSNCFILQGGLVVFCFLSLEASSAIVFTSRVMWGKNASM